MPVNEFSGELHRPLFAQIPLDLLSTCAERKRRRLVFVYAWLWFYAGRTDNAFPSIPRIALECGMKEDDVRASISTLLSEGWIQKTGSGPNGTNRYRVRMEQTRKRRSPKATARKAKSATPPPVKGTPCNRGGTPLNGPPVTGGGDPPLRGPRNGDPNSKPLNEEEENQEGLINSSTTYIHELGEKIDATPPLVTSPDGDATDRDLVLTSANNDAPQRHAEPTTAATPRPAAAPAGPAGAAGSPLPDCALPYRPLLRAWWLSRRAKHPSAPNELSAGDIQAILHADALGVLQPFLEAAVASGCKTLATSYRRRCEQLRAGPAAAAAFDTLAAAYLAAPRRVTCQSLPAAQRELALVLADGHTVEQLTAALAAEIRAQDAQHASTGFSPSLPDIARWLKERRFAAYLQQHQPPAPEAFVAPIDPETGAPDPFAYHRFVTGQQ
jgi:hypothetical protein